MTDLFPGFMATMFGVALFGIGFACGESSAPRHCEKFGAFSHGSTIYECKVKK
jgi:hypothetical protein